MPFQAQALTAAFALCAGVTTHFLAPLAAAEENLSQTTGIETLVVTGTRLEQTAQQPLKRTVLDRRTIEQSKVSSTLDLLRSVDGLHVTQYGGQGGTTSVFLQGAEPNFTVVFIDGVKVNDPNNSRGGSFNFNLISLAEIERIEIVRGPHSSIYGSDTLSGVINIVTRIQPDKTPLEVALEVGEDSVQQSAVQYTTALTDKINLSAGTHTAREGGVISGNHFQSRGARLRLRGETKLNFDLSARWFSADSEAFPEDSGGPELAELRDVDERRHRQTSLSIQLGYAVTDQTSWRFAASYLDQTERQLSPGIASGLLSPVPPNSADSELQRLHVSTFVSSNVNDQWNWVGGFDLQHEDGTQTGRVDLFPGFSLPTDFNVDRETLGVFGEISFDPTERIRLTAALRGDKPDSQSSETTARLGAQWATQKLRLYANWGEAFKLPSFFALGHGLVGNPNLNAERSQGWTVGADYTVNKQINGGASVFNTTYEDLIDFDFNLFTNVNRSRVDIEGVEAHVSVQQSNWQARAHVTYLDIDARDTTLRQRPNLRGGLSLHWQAAERLTLATSWLYVDDVFDSSIPTGPQTLSGYQRVDINATWQASNALTLWLALDNAVDESYQESVGFPAVGRRVRVGLKLSL